MGRSLTLVLFIIMLGMIIGLAYFTTSRAEAVTPTPDARSILSATGEALGASCNAAQAYAFLKTRVSGSANLVPQLTGSSDGSAKGGIDPELACRLQKFLQARSDIRIISGYRSAAYQESLCRRLCGARSCPGRCAPPGGSCHQYGLAVDVNKNDRSTRAQARQYKLHYPYSKGHIQCIEHKTAGRSSCNFPCAKDGVQITGGDYTPSADTPLTPPGSNSLSSPGGLDNLLNSLGSPSGGVGSPSGSGTSLNNLSAYNLAYEMGDEGGEAFLDNEYIGDGPPAFESLLGEFGEFNEGDEVREVLGYNDSSTSTSNVVPIISTGTSTREVSPINPETGECVEGVARTNIYGNIVCIRNISSGGEELDTTDLFFDSSFTDANTGLARTISTLVDSIIPIRHLVGGGSGTDGYIDDQYRLSAYDAYTPTEKFMYGQETPTRLTEEEFINFLVQENLLDNEPESKISAAIALDIIRPILMHIVFTLYGAGSYSISAVLNLAQTL